MGVQIVLGSERNGNRWKEFEKRLFGAKGFEHLALLVHLKCSIVEAQ